MSTSIPTTPAAIPVTDQAFLAARQQYLQNLANTLMGNVRNLQVNLMMADMAHELSDGLKTHLYQELIRCASIVEVREQ